MSLSNLQKEILACDDNAVFVEAAAASGKTQVLTERVKQEVLANKGQVVAFTFTVAAAQEMLERVGDIDKSNLFIGTIHAYCLKLLLSNGVSEALNHVEESEFDKLFELVKQHPSCVKPVYSVLCDEMQDCNSEQFEFIFDILQAERYFCCYDSRQSIYRWRDAHPEYINDYLEKLDGTHMYMYENYRNATDILDYAKSIITLAGYDYRDWSTPMRKTKGKVVETEYNPSALAKTIKKLGDYGNWFVLTRTNDQLNNMVQVLDHYEVPYVSFKRSELTNKELNDYMKQDKVKVLTIHTAKGLEAKYVVVIGAKFYNLEEKCISYVAATRARDLLVWTRSPKKQTVNTWNWER